MGIVWLAVVGSGWGAGSGGLTTSLSGTSHSAPSFQTSLPVPSRISITSSSSRTNVRDLLFRHGSRGFSSLHSFEMTERVLNIARAEVGVREATGLNDGKRVEEYLALVGLPKGHPYCAAFISWVFKKAGYDQPRTAWSPALFPKERVVGNSSRDLSSLRFPRDEGKGLVFGIYFPGLKRIAHCGFVSQIKGDWIHTIEANTSLPGSREGDGVYARTRHFRTIRCYADWIGKGGVK